MATIHDPSQLTITHLSGVTRVTLANRALLGAGALRIERVSLDAGAYTLPAQTSRQRAEHFLYVIRGTGLARVGAESFPLETESILWLEPGDVYSLEAGADALEVLLCRAPAED